MERRTGRKPRAAPLRRAQPGTGARPPARRRDEEDPGRGSPARPTSALARRPALLLSLSPALPVRWIQRQCYFSLEHKHMISTWKCGNLDALEIAAD